MIEPSGENYRKYEIVANDIDKRLAQIRTDTSVHSSPTPTLEHPDFLALVEMGDRIIPYLFHVMIEHGTSWVHIYLLHQITGMSPILPKHQGDLYGIIYDWLGWFLGSKYADSDIYCGLVD